MRLSPARLQVPGKWVLAGEHAVLRGADAVALPHPEYSLNLVYDPLDTVVPLSSGLEIDPPGAQGVIHCLLDEARRELGLRKCDLEKIEGRLRIRSSIPLGAGLGSSAALCVALTRWLGEASGLESPAWLEFARHLEDRFHGRSSGMDVAAVLAGTPIRFGMKAGPRPLGVTRLPRFTFHDTGRRARTLDCVRRVEAFGQEDPVAGREIDGRMESASIQAAEGLQLYDSGNWTGGLSLLSSAMDSAQTCFEAWNLWFPEAKLLKERLKSEGALSVKMTGAGSGGYLVALWNEP